MLLRLLAAFIVIPLLELYLLLRLADATSVLATFAIVVATGILGTILARREGVHAWHRFRAALAEGRMPNQEIQDGLMVVFAAALLLTPGLITDALGFTLLIPAGRAFIRRFVLGRYVQGVQFRVLTPDRADESPRYTEPLNRRGYTIDAEHFEPKR